MKVLITGSEGYIGSTLKLILQESKQHELYLFDKVLGNDITDPEEVSLAAREIDVIVHLASIVGIEACDQSPELAKAVILKGTKNVMSCYKRIIYTSVLASYPKKRYVTEETPVKPTSLYYRLKIKAEKKILKNPTSVVLRLGALYGTSSKMRDDLLVHRFCKDAIDSNIITVFEPWCIRPITNIIDVCRTIEYFIGNENHTGIYNVVSANLTKQLIVEKIKGITGCDVSYDSRNKDSEGRDYIASCDKLAGLGFKVNTDLSESFREVCEHYGHHQDALPN